MIIINTLLLIGAALFGGIAAFFFYKFTKINFQSTLIFAGGYLFAITILHILPDVFSTTSPVKNIGLYILIGFFLQLFLEFFSKGIEHGHIHHEQNKIATNLITLLTALCIHAVFDGVVLTNPIYHQHHNHAVGSTHHGMMLGIILHKIPAAFALVSFLNSAVKNKVKVSILLGIFSLASPVGLWTGNYFLQNHLLSQQGFYIVFAIISGGFLHIATTIFFESRPGHHFNLKKIILSLMGALVAALVTCFI